MNGVNIVKTEPRVCKRGQEMKIACRDCCYYTACCDCYYYEDNEKARAKAAARGETYYTAYVGNAFHWDSIRCGVDENPLGKRIG